MGPPRASIADLGLRRPRSSTLHGNETRNLLYLTAAVILSVFADGASRMLAVKKSWAIRKDSEGVSPVIGTILMVSITIILVAVLFVMVVGLGGNNFTPSVLVLSKNSVASGYKVQLTDATSEIKWGDVIVQLSEGANITSWSNLTTENLVSPNVPVTWHFGSAISLGGLSVFLNITDLGANGKINRGDSLTFTTFTSPTFSTSLTYTMALVYKPTGGSVLSASII